MTAGGKDFELVHAAPPEFYNDAESLRYADKYEYSVWKRSFDYDMLPDGKTLIFGHTPTVNFQDGRTLTIWNCPNGKAVGIDCGSGFPEKADKSFPFQGRLACVRLDDMQVFYSKKQAR